jgi:hypothetical protein
VQGSTVRSGSTSYDSSLYVTFIAGVRQTRLETIQPYLDSSRLDEEELDALRSMFNACVSAIFVCISSQLLSKSAPTGMYL